MSRIGFRWFVVWAAMVAIQPAHAVEQEPPRRQSAEALRLVVRELAAEAQEAMRVGFLRHGTPNVAERSNARIRHDDLQKAVTEPQNRDTFIDAYIRWQLTSFEFDLPPMTPRQFARFMDQAPAMIENPRGSPQVVSLFTRAADSGPLSPNDLAQVRDANRELDRQSQMAEALNAPALEFRAWVMDQLGDRGPERLLWLLENCAATINAAWPTREIKTRISQSFSASTSDASISDDDRRTIVEQVHRMAGLRRQFVNTVTFMADGSVRVTLSTVEVSNRDVENWIGRLTGE